MSLVLEYERPRFVERRTVHKPFGLGRVILLCLFGLLPVILVRGTPVGRWVHFSDLTLAALFAGPGVIAIVLVLASSFTCLTLVYPDRLQVDLFLARKRIWRIRYSWEQIETIKQFAGEAPGQKAKCVLRLTPGLKVIMYFGTGIDLGLGSSGRCLIGSDQVEELLSAIDAERVGGESRLS